MKTGSSTAGGSVATSDCGLINRPHRQTFENHSFPWTTQAIANMAGCPALSQQLELTA
jgi:hypothetical protein